MGAPAARRFRRRRKARHFDDIDGCARQIHAFCVKVARREGCIGGSWKSAPWVGARHVLPVAQVKLKAKFMAMSLTLAGGPRLGTEDAEFAGLGRLILVY